jgi:hypothetical protein
MIAIGDAVPEGDLGIGVARLSLSIGQNVSWLKAIFRL